MLIFIEGIVTLPDQDILCQRESNHQDNTQVAEQSLGRHDDFSSQHLLVLRIKQ